MEYTYLLKAVRFVILKSSLAFILYVLLTQIYVFHLFFFLRFSCKYRTLNKFCSKVRLEKNLSNLSQSGTVLKQFTVVTVSYSVPTYHSVEDSVTQYEPYNCRERLLSIDLVSIRGSNKETYCA